MKQIKRTFFVFQPSDHEAAQLWLTQLYDQGWELEHLPWFPFFPAKFVPRTREDVKYCVDLTHGVRDAGFAPDGFDRLVQESGWALVGTTQTGLDVYKSLPGRDPSPIQTDPALVRRQFFRRELLPSLIAALVVVLFFVLLGPTLGLRTTLPPNLLTSNRELLVVALLLYMIVFSFLTVGWGLRFWLRTPHTVPNLRLARVKSLCGMFFHLCWLFCMILIPLSRAVEAEQPAPVWEPQTVADLPLLTLEDLGLERDHVPEFRRRSSILASSLELMEYAGDASLTQERWDCRFDWVADQITADVLATHVWFTPPIPADLGFDQSWTYAGGDGFHVLLLRQGNTVVHLYGSPDLTTPDRSELLWDALELTS